MGVLKILWRDAFGRPPPSRKELRQELVKRLVARTAEGNIPLQKGHYITQQDADILRNRALAIKF